MSRRYRDDESRYYNRVKGEAPDTRDDNAPPFTFNADYDDPDFWSFYDAMNRRHAGLPEPDDGPDEPDDGPDGLDPFDLRPPTDLVRHEKPAPPPPAPRPLIPPRRRPRIRRTRGL